MKKILFITILIIAVFIVNNFVHSIYNLWQKKDLVVKIQKELEQKKKENIELKNKLGMVQDSQFIEKEARDKLMLVKPGESRVVIDEKLIKEVEGVNVKKEKTNVQNNLQKWWGLFFE